MAKVRQLTAAPEVEDGIPLPPKRRASVRSELTNVLLSMESGQSFLWPFSDEPGARVGSRIAALGRRYGRKFSLRTLPSGDLRVWALGPVQVEAKVEEEKEVDPDDAYKDEPKFFEQPALCAV